MLIKRGISVPPNLSTNGLLTLISSELFWSHPTVLQLFNKYPHNAILSIPSSLVDNVTYRISLVFRDFLRWSSVYRSMAFLPRGCFDPKLLWAALGRTFPRPHPRPGMRVHAALFDRYRFRLADGRGGSIINTLLNANILHRTLLSGSVENSCSKHVPTPTDIPATKVLIVIHFRKLCTFMIRTELYALLLSRRSMTFQFDHTC